MTPTYDRIHISASIRLAYTMLRLAADIETQLGRYVLDILKRQYPDQVSEMDMTGTQLGNIMVNKAKKELQNDYSSALDAVQEFVFKIMPRKGVDTSKFSEEELEDIERQKSSGSWDPKKHPKYQDKPEFDFRAPTQKGAPGAPNWKQALNNILNNVRTTAMSMSMRRFKKVKPSDIEVYADLKWKKEQSERDRYKWTESEQSEMDELEKFIKADGQDPKKIPAEKARRKGQRLKTIDEAFGTRGEDGGDASGGEGRMPTDSDSQLGRALDDKAAIKEFMDLLDEEVPNLQATLDTAERALFDLIFYEDVGSFGSDVKENMGQASELEEKLMETESGRAVVEKNKKRWSGFVGDLRKKLLAKITDFVEEVLSPAQQQVLYDAFFTDEGVEGEIEKVEQAKESEKESYQRGIDERKISRFKWETEQGTISDKDKKSYDSLVKKLKGQDVDVDSIKPSENPEGSAKTTKSIRDKRQQASIFSSQFFSGTKVQKLVEGSILKDRKTLNNWIVVKVHPTRGNKNYYSLKLVDATPDEIPGWNEVTISDSDFHEWILPSHNQASVFSIASRIASVNYW